MQWKTIIGLGLLFGMVFILPPEAKKELAPLFNAIININ